MNNAQKISTHNWRVTVTLCHFLGFLGIHRFSVGKIGTGLLWFVTCGMFVIGWITDIIMLYTGNFTDDDGALILPDSKRLLLETLRQRSGPAPADETAPQEAVIRMNHIRPDDASYIRAATDYTAIGLHVENDKIGEAALCMVKNGKIARRLFYQPGKTWPRDFYNMIGKHGLLIGYDLRKNFPAFAALLGDIKESAEWDYIDLRELTEARGAAYADGDAPENKAAAAIDFFEKCRAE